MNYRGRLRSAALVAISVASWLALSVSTSAQSAAALKYADAQKQEAALWATTPAPALTAIRSLAKTYESIVLRYPSNGVCDNALWQAAGLALAAYDRFADAADQHEATRYLAWLLKGYPSSPFAKEATAKIADLKAAALPASPSAVRAITRTALPRGDRITIEFSQETTYEGDRIASPDRVYFDFRNTTASSSVVEHASALGGTLIKSMRLGKRPDDSTRVVVELMDNPRFSVFPLYEPFRLVIDLERDAPSEPAPAPTTPVVQKTSPVVQKTTPVSQDAEPPPAPPAITSHGDYSLGRQLGLGIARIVIDPGHGGHDPGAQSNGLDEAELVLDVALRLEKLLKAQSIFDVVLTRRTDEFIPLEERTAIANRENADLFLSIHANASRDASARGIETYFLNFASNPAAEAVAARENASSGKTMGNLPEILRAIALNNKLAESRELATMVQSSMARRLKTPNAAVRDLGVKQAPFVVLIGAQMPSVLAEISFVTNRAEAGQLRQPAYRQKIAQALCDAVLKYRASLKKVTTLATRTDGK